jgi:hypothetical protein
MRWVYFWAQVKGDKSAWPLFFFSFFPHPSWTHTHTNTLIHALTTPLLFLGEEERLRGTAQGVVGTGLYRTVNLFFISELPLSIPPPGLLPAHRSNSGNMMKSNYLREMSWRSLAVKQLLEQPLKQFWLQLSFTKDKTGEVIRVTRALVTVVNTAAEC